MHDHKIYLENDVLYFAFGYLRAGDFQEIQKQIIELLSAGAAPQYAVLDFSRLMSEHSLIHPDDWHSVQDLIDLGKTIGIKKSYWIIPEDSIMYKEINNHIEIPEYISLVKLKDQALSAIKEYKKTI